MSMGIPHQIGSIRSETTSDGCLDEAGKHISAQWKPPSGLSCRTQRPKIDFDMHSLQVSSPPVSPCSSSPSADDWWRRPVYSPTGQSGGIRPDLSVACKAFEVQTEAAPATDREAGIAAQFERSYEEKVYDLPLDAVKKHGKAGVPVFVMLPLDSIKHNNTVNRRKALNASLQALKSAGVEGVMVDVWWGLVEREAPGQYNWSGYRELLEMVKKHGLKVQAVMSFHQCGGNVGDSANIPLPKWVVEEINRDNDLAYTDQWGKRNYEYISLGCDNLPVLKGRTPIQCYADYMRSFKETFNDLLGETIVFRRRMRWRSYHQWQATLCSEWCFLRASQHTIAACRLLHHRRSIHRGRATRTVPTGSKQKKMKTVILASHRVQVGSMMLHLHLGGLHRVYLKHRVFHQILLLNSLMQLIQSLENPNFHLLNQSQSQRLLLRIQITNWYCDYLVKAHSQIGLSFTLTASGTYRV